MPKVLLVAEKPSAARDFAAALTGGVFGGQGPHRGRMADGTELTVVSARGHLFELAKPETYNPKFGGWNVHDLPIVPTKLWDFVEEPRADGGNLLAAIRQEAAAHAGAEIVNGCDAEREGEVIFRKALRGVGAPSGTVYSRMWAQTMTVAGLREAFAARKPLKDYNGLAQAGFTRDQADWLVGMNVTVLATKTLPRGRGDWKVWSVGRVQTPTLALVVARDLLIENFVPQKFWEAHGTFGGVEAKAELDACPTAPSRSCARACEHDVTMAHRSGGKLARNSLAPGTSVSPSTSSISAASSQSTSASTARLGNTARRLSRTWRP